jgi:F-type H+-transporting ATPase subunit a
MGLKKPVFIAFLVVVLGLGVFGFVAGALGRVFFGDIGLPDWLIVESPHPELPAEEVFSIGGFAITNTMITAWISILVLGGIFWAATRKIKLVPGRLQAACEFVLEWILNLCRDAVGEKNGRRFFPLVVTIFLFVIVNAWMNLIPGYGAILITNGHGEEVHLLRGANTDINIPLALALISFVVVEYWGFSALGVGKYLKKFFNFGPVFAAIKKIFTGKIGPGFSSLFNAVINAFIGLLELLLEFVRIISFTFRLFGNMTGGEILLLMITFLLPFVVGIVFYGLELLVGFVQALIFAGLTLSFAAIAVTPHSEEH